VDGDRAVFESSIIIEYLQQHHPGPNRWIPDGDEGLQVRFFDRFFDLYIMNTMQVGVANALRPEGTKDAYGEERARERLQVAYDWLEASLGETWAVGESFTMADCAAAPSLFYADWVEEIGDKRPRLKAYRARLLAHPVVARAVDGGRPYRHYFPLGAPDRD
jgi:glutathione S-transferase